MLFGGVANQADIHLKLFASTSVKKPRFDPSHSHLPLKLSVSAEITCKPSPLLTPGQTPRKATVLMS